MVSQNGLGELTIGDSHEYGKADLPFDKTKIDEWILGYLQTFLDRARPRDRLTLARRLRQASELRHSWSRVPRHRRRSSPGWGAPA